MKINNRRDCHYGNKEVFTDSETGIAVYAGGSMAGADFTSHFLHLDLANNVRPSKIVQAVGFTSRELSSINLKAIKINWPDMETPDLNRHDWDSILSVIRSKGMPVLVSCMGGHGRTGTALSILAVLMGAFKPLDECPISWIRSIYCKNAVETMKQAIYVKTITKAEVDFSDFTAKSYEFTNRSKFNKKFDWEA